MNKFLIPLPFFLVLLVSSATYAQGTTQNVVHDPSNGSLHILKDTNPVFYIDSENVLETFGIGRLRYTEDVFSSGLVEFNNRENIKLHLSYGGIKDGACKNVYLPFGPPPEDAPDPDGRVFCFGGNVPVAAGNTIVTYDDKGVKHERSYVIVNPDNKHFDLDDFMEFKFVVVHELGHVVGMGHVVKQIISEREFDGGSVECSDCGKVYTLQPYDIAHLQALYPIEPEQYPEYPMHCVQKVGRYWNQNKNDYYFDYLKHEGSAYRVKTNLNPEKKRFDVDVLSVEQLTLRPEGDCTGLELVDDEIFIPYIIYEHFIYRLLLRLGGDNDNVYLEIVGACQIHPKTNESCGIDR